MSQQSLTNPMQMQPMQQTMQPMQPGVVVQKPRFDIYAMMLLLSLFAMLIAILCLYLEGAKYNWDIKAKDVENALGGAATAAVYVQPTETFA